MMQTLTLHTLLVAFLAGALASAVPLTVWGSVSQQDSSESSHQESRAGSAQRVAFAPVLEAGDAVDILYFRGLEQSRAGRTLSDGGMRVPVRVEVVGRLPSGLRVRWSFGAPELVRGERRLDLRFELDAELFRGLSIAYEADREGRLLAWTDAVKLRRDLDTRRDQLLEARRAGGASEQELDGFRRQLEHAYRPESIELSLLADPARFHAVGQGAWIVGVAEEIDAELANPFGEPVFPARERTVLTPARVDSLDVEPIEPVELTYVLERTRTLVNEQVEETLMECFRRLEGRAGVSAARADQLPEVEVSEVERHELDPESLWPTAVRFERRVEMAESIQLDRVDFFRAPIKTGGR